jgi:SAM-dependent methyltransferase
LKSCRLDQEDYDFLAASAEAARAADLPNFEHLKEPIGRWNYIRIADEIGDSVPPGELLDWGCGYGQMTYLLRRRGFRVTPFDIGAPQTVLPDVPLCRDLQVLRSSHPTDLPFPSHSFDVVLSCGVLEHVDEFSAPGNEEKSLREIRRVLRPGGYFLLYYLPQRWSWQEGLTRWLRLGYSHPRRYSAVEARGLLGRSGFRTERLRRANLFPRNVGPAPAPVRRAYGRFSRAFIGIDAALCRVPGLNRVSGVLEIIARPLP